MRQFIPQFCVQTAHLSFRIMIWPKCPLARQHLREGQREGDAAGEAEGEKIEVSDGKSHCDGVRKQMKTYHMWKLTTAAQLQDHCWAKLAETVVFFLSWLEQDLKKPPKIIKAKGNTHLLMVYTHDFNMTLLTPLWLIVLWINERGAY